MNHQAAAKTKGQQKQSISQNKKGERQSAAPF
jgi:hypothetical protein